MLRSLKTYGDPVAVTAEIDQELRSQGIDGRTGKVFLNTDAWLIGFKSIVKLRDVIGIGFTPQQSLPWQITAWRRGEASEDTVNVPEAEAKALLERLRVARPAVIVTNVKAFGERWKRISSAVKRPSTPRPPRVRLRQRLPRPRPSRTAGAWQARLIAPPGTNRVTFR